MSQTTRVGLRADAAAIGAVLDRLDRLDEAGSSKRRYTRHAFRTALTVDMVTLEAAQGRTYETAPRNLSPRGIALVAGAFIYPETRVRLLLPALGGEPVGVRATVLWCRHVARQIHEVGAEFEERIDPAAFIEGDIEPERSEISRDGNDILLDVERAGMQLAQLARDQRSIEEVSRAAHRIITLLESAA